MIRSFGNNDTERLWRRERSLFIECQIQRVALRELCQVASAVELGDLWSPPGDRLEDIVHGRRGITADTGLRLAKYFGTSAEFWLSLQNHYELDPAKDRVGEQIAAIRPLESSNDGRTPRL